MEKKSKKVSLGYLKRHEAMYQQALRRGNPREIQRLKNLLDLGWDRFKEENKSKLAGV